MQATTPRIEGFLVPILFHSQLYRAARQVNRHTPVIVMYHGFTASDSQDGIANYEEKHLHVRAFERHLAFLKTHHNVVPLHDLVRAYTAGAPLPERAAVITIDDGYRSTYTVAYPALVRFQLPAAVFLATEFVDGRRFLWTDRVEYAVNHARCDTLAVTIGTESHRLDLQTGEARMAADRRLRSRLKALEQETRDAGVEAIERAAGCSVYDGRDGGALYAPLDWSEASTMVRSGLISIGSHTHTHIILSRCTPARAADEMRVSKEIIESRLGTECRLFCYPNGRLGDFNAGTKALLKEHGYTGALTTVYGSNGRKADVYELKRYNLGKPMMRGEVAVRLSGIMEVGGALRRVLARQSP